MRYKENAMEIQHGASVIDSNGRVVGNVNHVVRDTWSGGIRRFIIRQKEPLTDLFLSPDDVIEVTESHVSLKVTLDELKAKD